MLTVAPIGVPESSRYASLVPTRYRRRLRSGSPHSDILLVGAAVLGQPCGAALARLDPHGRVVECESVFVAGPLRGQGIGRALLGALQTSAAATGCPEIVALVGAGPRPEAAQALFRALGWSAPALRVRQFELDPGFLRSPFVASPRDLDGCELVAASDLSAADRASIDRLREGVPPGLDPTLDPESLLAGASFALRREDGIVGWSALHEVAPGACRFSSLWVVPELRRRDLARALVGASLRAAFGAGLDRCRFLVEVGNRAMEQLVERQVAPYLTGTIDLHETRRVLAGRGR